MRPFHAISLLDEIAETVPRKLALRYGTPQLDLSLADLNDFPIATAWAAVNMYFLPNMKRVRPKICYFICCHLRSSRVHDVLAMPHLCQSAALDRQPGFRNYPRKSLLRRCPLDTDHLWKNAKKVHRCKAPPPFQEGVLPCGTTPPPRSRPVNYF